jgi:eukaryotic-like serine/threonine-protein kinase
MPDPPAALVEALRDRYAVERELGRGGMATVYLARDLKHDRYVALKVLHPDLAHTLGAERFLREIKFAARLQHPHILSVHDSGEAQGTLWFTMPFVAGETLRERLRRQKQLAIDETVRIAAEVARALDYAHREGVIHRDLKPENILLTGDGDTLVADFGIGRALGARQPGDKLTETGVVIGTPEYMSPEQAAGEADLDGRSDIYSLGAVVYEMLAGEPPFTGPTAQAVLARHFTEDPRPLRRTRSTVPEHVEQAVSRALARVPADRFDSARDFSTALGGDTIVGTRRGAITGPSRRWIRAAAAALAAGFIGFGGWSLLRPSTAAVLNADLVAVAPFDVLQPGRELELWREGLVDVLSRNLDGAGPLRTVSPTVVIRRWRGRAESQSAAQLGRRTGARLVVFGQLVGSGSDSVRLSATLYDVERGVPLGDVDLRGAAGGVDRMADSLTVRLLRELGRTRPVGAARRAAFGSGSLAALKAFLQGEQEYRRSNWDSAMAGYRRAIELDTGFALAYSRVGNILGWQRTAFDSLSDAYIMKAGELNHGLPPRESLLIAADSIGAVLFTTPPTGLEYLARLRRMFRTLDEAALRYPEDPLVWNGVGEARFHLGYYLGRPNTWSFESFKRATAVDSAFAPAYIHQVELAHLTGGAAATLPYLKAYLAQGPSDKYSGGMRLLDALLRPESMPATELNHLLDTASADLLATAYQSVWSSSDSAELGVRLARLLAEGRPGEKPWSDPANGRSQLARQLLRRGHVEEARPLLKDPQRVMRWHYTQAVMIGAVPAESAAVTFNSWLRSGDGWAARALWWWAERRDTTHIRHFIAAQDSVKDGREHAFLPHYIQAAPAYLALARRDTTRALELFMQLPDSLCMVCSHERLVRVRLLSARGRDEEAAARLEAPIANFPEAMEVVWALERGRVNERLGRRDKAAEAYGFVARTWMHADSVLQPVVTEAKAGLARLGEE